ncbi:MAG: M12 family metallo-peptidase [Pseudomonas helleri]
MALQESNIAFATTLGRTVVAHEIGHCFGATHAATSYYVDPEQFSPHGCATFMATERKEGTCARFRYSDENRGNIRNYVSQFD